MLVKTFPEFFASYKVYEIVKAVLVRNMREVDADKVMKDLISSEAKPEDFIKKMALTLRRHVNATKASNVILDVKEKMRELLDFKIEPASLEMSKNGKQLLKIYAENKLEIPLKFKVGLQQIDREYTAILYDPVKAFGYTKLIRSQIVQPGKMAAFKFTIKPDVFGIQDLYELKEKKELTITLGAQLEAEGIDGLRTTVQKIPVKIKKVGA